jgi:uncharacterized membrane protein YeaQ/YmgE (transglycosylase-associated protein family)
MLLLVVLVWGMFAGWIASLILGRRADWGTLLVAGLVGSFVGGLIASLIAGDGLDIRPSGLIGSIVGALIVLAIWGAISDRRSVAR